MESTHHLSAPGLALSADRQFVLTLIQNLKHLHRIAKTLDLPTRDIEGALAQIENQALSVVVVGEFKRGKSTFINALLGQDILPSDILPTTSTINRIVFGSTPSATVRFKDGRHQSIAIEHLANYVTKLTSDAEAISSKVQEALIHYPLHYCRNGVEIIDTPGLSDDDIMTEVTLSVLHRTEVVIMVTSAISPFAESEGAFLTERLLEQGIDHILFVVNGIDHFKRSEDVDRVLQSITQRIKHHIKDWANRQFGERSQEYNAYMKRMGIPRIYGLSSRQALQAKLTGDTSLLERSRFREFETSLNLLLTEERQRISLQMSVEGAIATATQILTTLRTQQQALQVQQQSMTKKFFSIIENLAMLRIQSREELDHLDRGFTNIESEVTTIFNTFGYELEQGAEKIIDRTSIDLSNDLNTIINYFADQVVIALRQVTLSIESCVTTTVNKEVKKQSLRLKIIAKSVDQKIYQMQAQGAQFRVGLMSKDSICRQCNYEYQPNSSRLVNLFPVDSSLFSIQPEVGGGYTVTGAVIGSIFSLGIGTGIGAAIGASLGEQQRKKTFKQHYKPQVLSVLKTRLNSENVHQKVNQYVTEQTSQLKILVYQVKQQIEKVVDETERNISTLQGRQDVEVLTEQKRLNEIESDVQQILNDAHRLLGGLINAD